MGDKEREEERGVFQLLNCCVNLSPSWVGARGGWEGGVRVERVLERRWWWWWWRWGRRANA